MKCWQISGIAGEGTLVGTEVLGKYGVEVVAETKGESREASQRALQCCLEQQCQELPEVLVGAFGDFSVKVVS